MHLAVAGLNQHCAPLVLRERLAVVPAEMPAVLAGLRAHVEEAFVLSTCNRVEVYVVAPAPDEARSGAVRFLLERGGASPETWASHIYTLEDVEAVRHLFRVASGLDSMVVGEGQILGQLRAALEAARRAGVARGLSGQIGAAALACGKRVRARTGIGRHAVSVVSVGLREVARALGEWDGRRVVVVGTGNTARLTLKHLSSHRGLHVTVVGRTYERAEALAARHGIPSRPFGDLADALTDADALITCTAAPHFVVRDHDLVAAGRDRSDRPLVCLDLGVPRDIDPVVTRFTAVHLIDVDRVQTISERNRGEREREIDGAVAVVESELERFLRWWRVRDVIPAIAQVRAAADALRDEEVARALARLPGLSPREARVVQSLARRVVGKLLHAPTATLRATGDRELAAAARRLFAYPPVEESSRVGVAAPSGSSPAPTGPVSP